jgi:hypothetical protein
LNIEAVRAMLLRDRDPLSIGENPNLADEYDAYMPGLLRSIDSNCSADQLESYLLDIEHGLRLRPDPATIALAVKDIFEAVHRGA